VLEAPWAQPGDRVILEGQDPAIPAEAEIDVENFFSVPITAKGGKVSVGAKAVVCGTTAFTTQRATDGEVG